MDQSRTDGPVRAAATTAGETHPARTKNPPRHADHAGSPGRRPARDRQAEAGRGHGGRAMSAPARALDAVVIGSGPNGLAAAIALARAGAAVAVLEAADTIGGGARTAEVTLPGFRHDLCSAAHPMGILSPFFRELGLEDHGLRWIRPAASVAHPLDDRPAVMLWKSLDRVATELGRDADAYRRLVAPLLATPHGLLADLLGPLSMPRHPAAFARFGLRALWPATALARFAFRDEPARALWAGCAAHAVLPLSHPATAALGLVFAITAHVEEWPVAAGGSGAIAAALAGCLRAHGGTIHTGHRVRSAADLPEARLFLFDTDPRQLADIAGDALPARYAARLRRYRYGPGAFKLDLALDGPIPWRDPRCLEASTVHVGGTLDEIAASERAMWRGEHAERPYLIVVQQSQLDPTRAPAGRHTGYAYCHVPHGSTVDMTSRIEAQIERFAPGFRDRILARRATAPADLERENPNYVGGAITGGVADLAQLFTRPVARLDPYSTPNPRVWICSASTPPGGGVHGMCGYHAATRALRVIDRLARGPLLPPAPRVISRGAHGRDPRGAGPFSRARQRRRQRRRPTRGAGRGRASARSRRRAPRRSPRSRARRGAPSSPSSRGGDRGPGSCRRASRSSPGRGPRTAGRP